MFRQKGKTRFIEDDMARSNDTATVKVEASVPVMICGVAKKDASCGSCSKFMRGCRSLIRIAQASESTKMTVGGGRPQQALKWGDVSGSVARAAIHKMSSCVQSLDPKGSWHASVKKNSAETIVECPDNTLSLPILRRSVGAGET